MEEENHGGEKRIFCQNVRTYVRVCGGLLHDLFGIDGLGSKFGRGATAGERIFGNMFLRMCRWDSLGCIV